MRALLSAVLLLSAAAASAQTLESSYDEAVRLHGRVTPSAPKTCWTRGASEAADAAGMPLEICVSWLKLEGKTATVSGTALLAGGAQRETLYGQHPISGAAETSWTEVFHWEAGKGESDEESVVQIAFRRDASGALVPGSEKLIAFHQCPERGCSYACGVTSVAFKLVPSPVSQGPRTSY